ncbi:hypothetical protein WN944_020332 [Citrus x changshan-huyou]|uniref:Uncharacterized protein n=1 Tax=Citrus x changshan-huyou TaxID=2935761 RepID=A0AAP0QES9_9ROSI
MGILGSCTEQLLATIFGTLRQRSYGGASCHNDFELQTETEAHRHHNPAPLGIFLDLVSTACRDWAPNLILDNKLSFGLLQINMGQILL